ncbi:MAG: LUD domain-containing protein [Thermoleophilia bacterium]|nr:LUD domain-containing protein [Thermoleophilia bacterium]
MAAAQVSAAPVSTPLVEELLASLSRRKASGQVAAAGQAGWAAARWMADAGVTRAVLADDPLVQEIGLPDALRRAGIEVLTWPTGQAKREALGLEGPPDVCGVTVPALAVAERGTVVLEASAGHGRGIDVTSRHHVALLPADRIVQTLAQALARTFDGSRPVPSAVSLVSGPSRSSDIEKISTLGAHGALTEHVVVIT